MLSRLSRLSRGAPAARACLSTSAKQLEVLGTPMAYVEGGDPAAPPIVFLHGNPTSSYLWRNIMPHCEGVGRTLAPDLVGMGKSGRVRGNPLYSYGLHMQHLEKWFELMGLDNVTLVLHDWGSALGFDWAERNRGRVAGIVHMESITAPIDGWDNFPDAGRKIFQAMWKWGGNISCEGIIGCCEGCQVSEVHY